MERVGEAEFMDSEEGRGETDAEADADVEAVGEVMSNSERSAEDDEGSSDDDEYDDVIDTSTVKRVVYPPAGNQASNQATPAGKHGDGDGLKAPKQQGKGKTVTPVKEESHDSESDSNPGAVQQQQSSAVPSYHMQQQLGVNATIARLFFDCVLKGDIDAVKKQENRMGLDVQY